MFNLIFRLLCLLILGGVVFDITQMGSFQKSHTYQYLNDTGIIDYGAVLLKEGKILFSKGSVWAEKNVPVYYNEVFTYLKPHINASYDLAMSLKSNVVSLIHHITIYLNNNFPAFQNNVSLLLNDAVILAKKSLVVISGHLENYTISAVQYANNMLGS